MDIEKIKIAAGEIWLYMSEVYKVDVDIDDIFTMLYNSLR